MRLRWVLPVLFLLLAAPAFAADASSLKPPPGSKVALVVFEDLQCPDCARAAPLLEEAARVYKIPLVRYDFPLTKHVWAKQAAILARWFDSKSVKIGNEFRDYCFRHQSAEMPLIKTPADLQTQAEEFAKARNLTMPFAIDPQGMLEKKVDDDVNLGVRIGLEHTPTIFVISDKKQGQPFIEVVDRSNLFAMIDEMKRQAGAATTANKAGAKKTP